LEQDPLDGLIWYIGRAFYAYIGRLEVVLAHLGLDRHLRPGMGPILFALFEEDNRSIKDIAGRTQLSSSTLTGVLGRMEAAGLVDRRRDEDDGRVVRVRLTALGRSLEPRCREALHAFDTLIQANLREADIRQAKELLRRFTETMRTPPRLAAPRRVTAKSGSGAKK
jgi:DNA-binding MarR family transcriptional regulator